MLVARTNVAATETSILGLRLTLVMRAAHHVPDKGRSVDVLLKANERPGHSREYHDRQSRQDVLHDTVLSVVAAHRDNESIQYCVTRSIA